MNDSIQATLSSFLPDPTSRAQKASTRSAGYSDERLLAALRANGAPILAISQTPRSARLGQCVRVHHPNGDYVFERIPQSDGRGEEWVCSRVRRFAFARVRASHGLTVRMTDASPSEALAIPVARVAVDTIEVDTALSGVASGAHPIEVAWPGGALRLRAIAMQEGTTHVLRVVRESTEDYRRWEEEVTRLAHPNTAVGRPSYAGIWDLFRRAGYFGLSGKDSTQFTALEQSFLSVSERMRHAPHLACQTTYTDLDRVEASITMLKTFSHAWFVYQLAREKRRPLHLSGHRPLYELYNRATEHTRRDPDLRYHVIHIQREGSPFTKLIHRDFTRRHEDGANSAVVGFHAFEGRCEASSTVPSSRFAIGEATVDERAEFFRTLEALRPRAYCEAQDLVPERFDLEELKRTWKDAGLRRERFLLVARRGVRAVAAALVESADDGLHLFGLLDCVRVFPLAEDGAEAYEDLLDRAARFYAERGKKKFVFFDEWNLEPTHRHAGFESLGLADTVITSAETLGAFLEGVLVATSPRES